MCLDPLPPSPPTLRVSRARKGEQGAWKEKIWDDSPALLSASFEDQASHLYSWDSVFPAEIKGRTQLVVLKFLSLVMIRTLPRKRNMHLLCKYTFAKSQP